MDITKVHIPSRLEGESRVEYAIRRRMSKRLNERSKLLVAPKPNRLDLGVTYLTPDQAERLRHELFKSVGARQAKKALRSARAAKKAQGA